MHKSIRDRQPLGLTLLERVAPAPVDHQGLVERGKAVSPAASA
jgi:hypothetical protein